MRIVAGSVPGGWAPGEDASASAAADAAGPGLVLLSTSQTDDASDGLCVEFDPKEARLRRMRDGISLGVRLGEAALERPGFRAPVAWMLTLTYAKPEAWEPRHVSSAINRLGKWAARSGFACAGAWCAEMQDRRYRVRGELAVHYHVIVWLPAGVRPPKLDQVGWWGHGMTRVERVQKSATAYISKYASKGSEAPLPKGARIYGVFGLGPERVRYSFLRRPLWLRQVTEMGQLLKRALGGGWLDRMTGELLVSPWVASFHQGKVRLRWRVRELVCLDSWDLEIAG